MKQSREKCEDDSRFDIKRKGLVWFVFKDGRKTIMNYMYYICELKRNIVSLSQETEAGCEVQIKEDLLMVYECLGQLFVKIARSRDESQ